MHLQMRAQPPRGGLRRARVLAAVACAIAVAHGARADEPGPRSRLAGRLFEAGSAAPIAGAPVQAPGGASTTTDGEGRFSLELPSGEVAIAVIAGGYEPLRLVEKLPPHVARTVEYRLLPQSKAERSRY